MSFAVEIRKVIGEDVKLSDVVFLCIGTDRSTGDSLGPMVGTMLERCGYENVIGTLDEPCHAVNLHERAGEIPKGKKVIAIDAALGELTTVGKVRVKKGSLRPAAGVGKDMGKFGDFSITGTVNVGGFMEYFVLQNTRLSTVMKMADEISQAMMTVFPVNHTLLEVAASEELAV